LVDRLERRGYARREPHPTDRRSILVQPLIENAERDLGPAYVTMGEAMNDLMSRYDDADLATILDFMTRAATITAEQIAKLRSQAGNCS
jgi:DNA-binding MarR family transcriptional regulator